MQRGAKMYAFPRKNHSIPTCSLLIYQSKSAHQKNENTKKESIPQRSSACK